MLFILTREFTVSALERALKTAAQAGVLAILGTGSMEAVQSNAFAVNWMAVLGFVLGGFVLSYLTSVASANVGKWPGPSLTDEAVLFIEEDDDPEILVEVDD